MSGAEALLAAARETLALWFIVFLRVGPVMSMVPGFGEQTVPVRIRLALAIAFTAVVAPAVAGQLAATIAAPPPLARLVLFETATGLMLGIGLRLFLLALQTAGSIAAQATSVSQILGNAGVTPLPAMGHLLVVAGLALAMILGLHIRLALALIETYDLFPVALLPDAAPVARWGIGRVARAFSLAFTLAAPFVILSVLYNLTLGIINRAMPQLLVVFVGAPAITAAGLGMLLLLAPAMLTLWTGALGDFLSDPYGGR
jgi:flagellar biosynthetic protein FliR